MHLNQTFHWGWLFECIKIDASLICRPYLQNNHYNRHCAYSGVALFVTNPHFSPNRNIGPNYCTMLMLAINHRHDDHSRLSSSANSFLDVWHNLPFKKRRPTLQLSRMEVYRHDRSGLQRCLLGYRHDTGDLLLLIPWVWQCARNVWRRNLQVERDCLVRISLHERRTCRMI